MQEPVPTADGHPALDSALRKALAKEPGERYGTCAELIDAARLALAGVRVPAGLVRRRRVVLAAGVVALVATAVAAAFVLRDDAPSAPEGNGLAMIAADGGEIASFAAARTPPSNIAVGEGAVWLLNTEDESVSRVDPETGEVAGTWEPRGVPTDIAAGGGAVWIGTSRGGDANYTTRIARHDPETGELTRIVELPDSPDGGPPGLTPGFPRVAVGDGAVWAINADQTISRIDPETGRIVAKVPTPEIGARTVAAGDAGVWVLGYANSMVRIDPRTNRAEPPIELGSNYLPGIAVGGGAVWVSSEEGQLWRVEPGPRPLMRTIEVGAGVQYVAYGDGAVWAANWNDGTVARVDPSTNAVTTRIPVGATQALAAGAGSAWVSVAGAPRDGTLPATACGEIASGGRTPDVIVASDMPLQGAVATTARQNASAVRYVIEAHGFRAGDHVVGYQSCDDSTAQTGVHDPRRCAANAQAFSGAEKLVAVVGPYNSQCAQIEVPIANRAAGGPLAIVSPSTTSPNLTRGGELALPPPFGFRGEPGVYYPSGERNLLRLAARGDLNGVALAEFASDLGLRSVYLLNDGPDGIGNVLFTDGFERAAPDLGVGVTAVEAAGDPAGYAELAERVAASGADGVLLGTFLDPELLRALRERLGRRVVLLAGEGFLPPSDVLEAAGEAAEGLYVASPELTPGAVELSADGERFVRGFGRGAHTSFVLQTAQATEAVLAAIAGSDGTRSSVLQELQATEESDGLFGHFRFDRYGDITPARFVILRVTAQVPPGERVPGLENAVAQRVIEVPAE
jgi:branched-chain amino acid transport system substrate-binding protein